MFNGVKTFSATRSRERNGLGDQVTTWLRENKDKEVVDTVVAQSSDAEFHCVTIVIFYMEGGN